jgi:signal transduction histidine kinase
MEDSDEAIARDIEAVGRIGAVPSLLRIICNNTGMRFAAVARVTDATWTACAVYDGIGIGLKPGGRLDVSTTLCVEARAARRPIVIDHASRDPVYASHHTPRIYQFESYISVPIVLPDGKYFGNLCALDPRATLVSDERTVRMFTLFAELIALQLDNDSRQQAVETALLDERATAELREQFIAVLGHDLRNPLAAIDASAELLRRRQEADMSRLGDRLKTATRRMSRLIDDVLDFARGRLGSGMSASIAAVPDLETALREVVAELQAANTTRMMTDAIDIDMNVCCDRARVQQLASNLLGNALVHGSPHDPVRLDAHVADDVLVLAVSNRGDPILPADLKRIFEPYWRPAQNKGKAGLGLGLHICSQIVKAHGGSLEASSSAETGTTFVARLPVRHEGC